MLDRRRRLARRHRRDRRPAGRRARLGARCCTAPRRTGIGPAYLAGFRHALDHGAGYVMEMDSDFSHDPADLARLLAAVARRRRPRARLALRARRRRRATGGCCGASSARAARRTRALVLGLRVRDLTGGFKCFRREVLEAIDFDGVRSHGLRLPGRADLPRGARGFRVVEVPIVFRDRQHGKSKMSLADRRRGDVAGAALRCDCPAAPGAGRAPLTLTVSLGDRWTTMDASAYAFAHGVRHTRATLRAWQRDPGRRARALVRRLRAGRRRPAARRVARSPALDSRLPAGPRLCSRRSPSATSATSLSVLARNLLVLALHAMACVAGFIAGSSLPLQAEHHTALALGPRARRAHRDRLRRRCATTFSLSAQAYVLGAHARRRLALPATSRPGCCCSACCRTRSPS